MVLANRTVRYRIRCHVFRMISHTICISISVLYDIYNSIIRYRLDSVILTFDVLCHIAAYDIGLACACRRGRTYWPGPGGAHGSCLLVFRPAGRPVLHRHGLDPHSLSLAYNAAPNMCSYSLVRAKTRSRSGAWSPLIAPTAHKVIEGC